MEFKQKVVIGVVSLVAVIIATIAIATYVNRRKVKPGRP